MAWMAYEHLRASGMAGPHDPSVIDRNTAAAWLCGLAAIGLMVLRVRAFVAASIVLGTVYMLSARQLDGTLGLDALTHVPVVIAALFVCWPQLVRSRQP
jgi:hypothetical protein